MRTLIFLLHILFCVSAFSYGQYNIKENNVWVFGSNAGIDFNYNPPKLITTISNSFEGCSSVCDSNGKLLFFSDGYSASDSTGTVFPNAQNDLTTFHGTYYNPSSCTQASLIIPVIGNKSQYYLFSLEGADFTTTSSRLFYSIVDMTLNHSLGDIVPGKKAMLFDTGLTEKMIAIPSNDCGIWLLVHTKQNDTFKAYKIDNSGIRTAPVRSIAGVPSALYSYGEGVMKISPDRSRLIVCSAEAFNSLNGSSLTTNGTGAELFDFDPNTGIVSNLIVLIQKRTCYGAEFSPDNKKVYISSMDSLDHPFTAFVSQFDLSLGNSQSIINSRVDFNTSAQYCSDLRLGPDRKIYGTNVNNAPNGDSMNIIYQPNLKGNLCQFTRNALAFDSGTTGTYGLPNMYVKPLCIQDVPTEAKPTQTFYIYPNPGNGSFTIDQNVATNQSVQLEVLRSDGRVVYRASKQFSGQKISFEMPGALPGLYLIRLSTNDKWYSLKLVIN